MNYEVIEKIFEHNAYRIRVIINPTTQETIFLNYNHDPTQEEINISVGALLNSSSTRQMETIETLTDKIENINKTVETLNSSIPGQRVSARQVRVWLIKNGISLDQIDLAISNIQDPFIRDITKIEWEYAPYIDRNHTMLSVLAQSLGLSQNTLDQAFMEASFI